ncbi:MAG TPA: response regulator [Saprospiraceae bacterium]|nr:response regulator [Saprospiraceae bacterium]
MDDIVFQKENKKVQIAIIEDESVIATSIYNSLKNNGYEPLEPGFTYEEGLKLIENNSVDLALIDIRLKGAKTGIDLARKINETVKIPVIFISAFSDQQILKEAKETMPVTFLVKPVNKNQLLAAVEMAIGKPVDLNELIQKVKNDSLTIKDGFKLFHVEINQILYIECDRNYMTYFLNNGKKIMERITMKELETKLSSSGFIKINRSQLVNADKIKSMDKSMIQIGDVTLKFSKKAKSLLKKHFNLI